MQTGAGAAELDFTGPIPAARARQLACDAGISRIITAGASQPLDVGRRTRTVPAQLRRALAARDRGCRFPGCDRPVAWCDAHHLRHWADGGPTVPANLVLLCRLHHTMIHQGWELTCHPDGTTTATPPLDQRAEPGGPTEPAATTHPTHAHHPTSGAGMAGPPGPVHPDQPVALSRLATLGHTVTPGHSVTGAYPARPAGPPGEAAPPPPIVSDAA